MSWDQHFDALAEYKRKFGTWVVNPHQSAGEDNPVLRQTYEALAGWVSYQQCHTQNMNLEQRLKWALLTGQQIPKLSEQPSRRSKQSKLSHSQPYRPASAAASAAAAARNTADGSTPSDRQAARMDKPPTQATTAEATFGPAYKHNTPTAPTTTTDASLWSGYRTKGVGLSQMQWNSMFDKLLAFRKVHGHVTVPVRFKADPKLGKWVSRQRESRISMAESRRDRLNAIGFS